MEIKSRPNVNRLYTESLIIQLCTHLVRRYSQFPDPGFLPSGLTPSRLRRVIEFINAQIDQEIRLEELAQVAEQAHSISAGNSRGVSALRLTILSCKDESN